MTLQATIAAWHHKNEHTQNPLVEVAGLLAKSPDMNLVKIGVEPMQIVKMVDCCLRAAVKDANRLSAEAEKESIKDVQAAAKALAEALHGAQLLGVSAPLCEIDGDPVFVAWTADCASAIDNHSKNAIPVVPLPDLLRILQSQCAGLIKRPPSNSLVRRGDDKRKSARRSFVQHLSARFIDQFGKAMPTNITHVTNAIFQLDDPISVRSVAKLIPKAPLKGENDKA